MPRSGRFRLGVRCYGPSGMTLGLRGLSTHQWVVGHRDSGTHHQYDFGTVRAGQRVSITPVGPPGVAFQVFSRLG